MKARIYSGTDLVALMVDVSEERIHSVASGIKALYPREVCKLQIGKMTKIIPLPSHSKTSSNFVGFKSTEKPVLTRKSR